MSKATPTRSFRLWDETRERLEFVEKLGGNSSQLVNEVLRDHLKAYVERLAHQRQAEIRKTLAAGVP